MIHTDSSTLREITDAEAARLERRQLNLVPLAWVLTNNLATVGGPWLEFGVYSGTSINAMAKFAGRPVYGFEGLPEDCREEKPRGRYSLECRLPDVSENVRLVQGWFNEMTLYFFKRMQVRRRRSTSIAIFIRPRARSSAISRPCGFWNNPCLRQAGPSRLRTSRDQGVL